MEYDIKKVVPIIKNLLIFQFRPESVSRDISVPTRNLEAEVSQSGTPPTEKMSFTVKFDSSDQLNKGDVTAQTVGIAPQLAAL